MSGAPAHRRTPTSALKRSFGALSRQNAPSGRRRMLNEFTWIRRGTLRPEEVVLFSAPIGCPCRCDVSRSALRSARPTRETCAACPRASGQRSRRGTAGASPLVGAALADEVDAKAPIQRREHVLVPGCAKRRSSFIARTRVRRPTRSRGRSAAAMRSGQRRGASASTQRARIAFPAAKQTGRRLNGASSTRPRVVRRGFSAIRAAQRNAFRRRRALCS